MTTIERLQAIMRDILDDDTIELTRASVAADYEDWDSLAQISAIVAIEKEFAIKFDFTEVEAMKTVGDTVDQIDRKLR